METLIHLIKGSLGTGILAMPQAISFAGLLFGGFATCMIGMLCTYCLHILIRSQYKMCKKLRVPLLSYPESMLIALQQGPPGISWLAPASPYIVDGFLIFYQVGICCCYVVFVAASFKQFCDHHWFEMDVRLHMCIILLPLMAINCVRNLHLLTPFSLLANVITFLGLGIILWYILHDVPPISERDMIGDIYRVPLFFGTTLFALEAVGVMIALESNMKTPADFLGYFGVLNIGMTVIVLLYVMIGILGYMKYGDECLGSITLNLPETDGLAETVKISMALAVFISYALQCYVPINIIWNDYMISKLEGKENKIVWEFGLRIIIVIITFVAAVAIPRLGLFISLIGAFSLSVLGLAFPGIIELSLFWYDDTVDRKTRCFTITKDFILIIFAICGLFLGTIISVEEIIKSF